MAATVYTLKQVIDDAYQRRYQNLPSEATTLDRLNIARFAELRARIAWRQYNFIFGIESDTATVASDNTLTLPSNCEDLLLLTTSVGVIVSYTQEDDAATITILDSGLTNADLTLQYRTNEPTYATGVETYPVPTKMYEYLVLACVSDLWGGDQQLAKKQAWAADAVTALSASVDVQERQRNLRRRYTMRTYRRGR